MKGILVLSLVILIVGCVQTDTGTGEKTFDLEIVDKVLNLRPPLLQVQKGDDVSITISADERGEFHIHGYDKTVKITPGKDEVIEFIADLEGKYEIDYHLGSEDTEHGDHEDDHAHTSSDLILGALEVLP